jgi:hypothetical protein
MLISNPGLWNHLKNHPENSSDEKKILEFVCQWAEAMEAEIKTGKSVADCAESTLKIANTLRLDDITLARVIDIMGSIWMYGEELIDWFVFKRQDGKKVFIVYIPRWFFEGENNN